MPLPACEIDPVIPPGEEVAVYEVIVAPPSEVGAVNETFTVDAPVDVAVTEVGAPGALAAPAPTTKFVSSTQDATVPEDSANVPSELIVTSAIIIPPPPPETIGTLILTTPVEAL